MVTQKIKTGRHARLNERLAHIQQDLYAKRTGLEAPPPLTVEDEDVRIGDSEVHYHEAPKTEPTSNKWLPVIGAALLGLGITAGVLGAKALMSGPDSDTQYNLGGEWVES